MIQVQNATLTVENKIVLQNVSFSLVDGEKVAIVGPNGSGKTTLLRAILGYVPLDSGRIITSGSLSYMPQRLDDIRMSTDQSILSYMETARGLSSTSQMLASTQEKIDTCDQEIDSHLVDEYYEMVHHFQINGGYEIDPLSKKILAKIGLPISDLSVPISSLSGGQKTLLAFSGVLFSDSNCLLLDEPTNHLDQQSQKWLLKFLINYHGSVLVVSHRKDFLDPLVSRVLFLDDFTGQISSYTGNYSDTLNLWKTDLVSQQKTIKKKQKEIIRLDTISQQWRGSGKKRSTQGKAAHRRADRIRADLIGTNILHEKRIPRFILSDIPRSSSTVLTIRNLTKSFHVKPVLANINIVVTKEEKLAITGPLGSGKTTLLKIIAGKEGFNEGTVQLGSGVKLGYYAQELETLDPNNSVIEEIKSVCSESEQTVNNFLAHFLFRGSITKQKVKTLSQGEKCRLMIAKLVMGHHNLLVLDEPTNHLDQASIESISHINRLPRYSYYRHTRETILLTSDWSNP